MAAIDLQKKAEKVGIILAKKGITQAPTMRVGVAIDISGSMANHWSHVQNAFNQLMGVAVKFDDNGELDVFQFDTRCEFVDTASPQPGDYDNFIRKNHMAPRGGTAYTPVVESAIDFYFGGPTTSAAPEKKGFFGKMFSGGASSGGGDTTRPHSDGDIDCPVLLLILTDGEPGDSVAQIERAMRDVEDKPIYFHMVGLDGDRRSFPTIAKLADDLDNVGEVYLPRLDMSDDEIYEQLIGDELIEFIGKFSGIVKRARA